MAEEMYLIYMRARSCCKGVLLHLCSALNWPGHGPGPRASRAPVQRPARCSGPDVRGKRYAPELSCAQPCLVSVGLCATFLWIQNVHAREDAHLGHPQFQPAQRDQAALQHAHDAHRGPQRRGQDDHHRVPQASHDRLDAAQLQERPDLRPRSRGIDCSAFVALRACESRASACSVPCKLPADRLLPAAQTQATLTAACRSRRRSR